MEFITNFLKKLYYAFCVDGDELNSPEQTDDEEVSQPEEESNDNHS